MILAADIGNSNIVIGCFEGDKILFTERLSTNRHATAMEYMVLIKSALEFGGFGGQTFEGGIISSVVPAVTRMVKDAMTRIVGKPPLVVGPGLKTGLKIRLHNAAQGLNHRAQLLRAVIEIGCVFFCEGIRLGHTGHHEVTHGAPLPSQRRSDLSLMKAQKVIDRHHRAEIAAFLPKAIPLFFNTAGFPMDPAKDAQIAQVQIPFIRGQAVLADHQLLVIFQEDPLANIHLKVVIIHCANTPTLSYFTLMRPVSFFIIPQADAPCNALA